MMVDECGTEPIDRIVRRCGDVPKGAPVIGNQGTCAKPFEQNERVIERQMAFAKAELPPGGVTDR